MMRSIEFAAKEGSGATPKVVIYVKVREGKQREDKFETKRQWLEKK